MNWAEHIALGAAIPALGFTMYGLWNLRLRVDALEARLIDLEPQDVEE